MNHTYGYASASFSGRMPCSILADSIMEMARQTLEYCIKIVEDEFKCPVLYADTDSMFVYVKNKVNFLQSKTDILVETVKIGNQILQRINSAVPAPIRLKFERIYMPCVLVTKKRYAGQSYNPEVIS